MRHETQNRNLSYFTNIYYSFMVRVPFIDKRNAAIISSYRRLINLSKILSCLGLILILYVIYIHFNHANNSVEATKYDDTGSYFDHNHKTDYEIKIVNSIFNGLNKNLSSYQIQALHACRTLNNQYELEKINATYPLNNNELLVIKAKNGILNENKHVLQLKGDVQISLGENIVLMGQQALLNLGNKEAYSKTPVALSYKNCKITSNNFSSTNDNNIIVFKGNVSTVIDVSHF